MNESISRSAYRARRRQRRRRFFFQFFLLLLILCGMAIGVSQLLSASGDKPKAPAEGTDLGQVSGYIRLQMDAADLNQGDLTLVNQQNPADALPEPQLTQLINGHAVDSRCYPQLQKMMDDCRAAGLDPLICSSYRSQEKQAELFTRKVSSYLDQGYGQDKAQELASREVSPPGTSEHQLGLAVDICAMENQNLDSSQADTPVQKWLMANCQDYGFILRYDEEKSDLTDIIYEPWHYRYVGTPHAQYMAEQDLCLEEYISLLQTQYAFSGQHLEIQCGGQAYEVYYCQGLQPYVPTSGAYTISGSNTGGFIITAEKT